MRSAEKEGQLLRYEKIGDTRIMQQRPSSEPLFFLLVPSTLLTVTSVHLHE